MEQFLLNLVKHGIVISRGYWPCKEHGVVHEKQFNFRPHFSAVFIINNKEKDEY